MFPQWNLIKLYYSLFSNVDLIIPNLWLGNYHAALDYNFVTSNNIDIIVNCTPDIPFISDQTNTQINKIQKIRIPVYDSQLEKDLILMEQYLKVIIPILHTAYKENKKILVHCYAGKQRSAIVIASLLFFMSTYSSSQHFILPYLSTFEQQEQKDILINKHSLINSIFYFIIDKRPQAFTYGFRINFKSSFDRLFQLRFLS